MAEDNKKKGFGGFGGQKAETVNETTTTNDGDWLSTLGMEEAEEDIRFSDFRTFVVKGSVQSVLRRKQEEDGSQNWSIRMPTPVNGVMKTKTVYLNTKDDDSTIEALVGRKVEFTDITANPDREVRPTADVEEKILFMAKGYKDIGKADDGFNPEDLVPKNTYYYQSGSMVGQVASIKHKESYGSSGYAHLSVYWRDEDGVARPFEVLGDITLVSTFKQMIANSTEIVNKGGLVRINGLRKEFRNNSVVWYSEEKPTSKDEFPKNT